MKPVLVLFLMGVSAFAGNGGGGAGVGGGGVDQLKLLRDMHPELSDCQIVERMIEEGQTSDDDGNSFGPTEVDRLKASCRYRK